MGHDLVVAGFPFRVLHTERLGSSRSRESEAIATANWVLIFFEWEYRNKCLKPANMKQGVANDGPVAPHASAVEFRWIDCRVRSAVGRQGGNIRERLRMGIPVL